MRTRQLKRWCDDCKLMVFSLGHEHGLAVGPKNPDDLIGLTENADLGAARAAAVAHVNAKGSLAMLESGEIFEDKLKSAVGQLKE